MGSYILPEITIENLAVKLPPIKETDPPLYGLVDMGSNGIRFSITDLAPPNTRLLRCIFRERAGISLYDALHESTSDSRPFYFSEETITKVAEVLARFKSICDSYIVQRENILVFATEAMRTARNKNDMLQAIEKSSGLEVEMLNGKVESLFGALGARSGFEHVDGLFMDLGGGSVQMTYVNSKSFSGQTEYHTAAAKAARSLPFGAAKLTEQHKLMEASMDTSKTAAVHAKLDLATEMEEIFQGIKQEFPQLKKQSESSQGITIYLCGGGFRGYGSILMHTDPIQPYPIPAIGGYTVPGARFKEWPAMLAEHNNHDGKIFGMSKRRRDQFPAIIDVISALVLVIPVIKEVIFCSGGNREGALYTRLPANIRERDPLEFLPGGVPDIKDEVVQSIVDTISHTIPKDTPKAEELPQSLFSYLARHMYLHMGRDGVDNSSWSIHDPISGFISNSPGLTHKTRALYSLTMCARWGTAIAPIDKQLYLGLRDLVGPELSFLCGYIGTTARLIGSVIPAIPKSADEVTNTIKFTSSSSSKEGKKGIKRRIHLNINIDKKHKSVFEAGIADVFVKVANGLQLRWEVKTVFA